MICNLLVQDFYSYCLGFIQNAFSSILNSALQSNSGTLADVRYFSKGIFLRDNFIIGNFLMVRLGLLRRLRLQWGPSAASLTG